MMREFGQGLVIDYSSTGYSACQASEAINAEGRARVLRDMGRLRDLGRVLADDFLGCHIGVSNLFYDPAMEEFMRFPSPETTLRHAITTVVRRLQ
jgi:hypothetical protein